MLVIRANGLDADAAPASTVLDSSRGTVDQSRGFQVGAVARRNLARSDGVADEFR